MMTEILGKETGYCKGRGGSMHIAAFETGSLVALAVVGTGIPLAVGAALAFKRRGKDEVTVILWSVLAIIRELERISLPL